MQRPCISPDARFIAVAWLLYVKLNLIVSNSSILDFKYTYTFHARETNFTANAILKHEFDSGNSGTDQQ